MNKDALIGLAELLDGAGIGLWSLTAAYPSDAVGIVLGRLPLRPVAAIGLTPYRVAGAEPDSRAGIAAVQMRFRAAKMLDVLQMQTDVAGVLDFRGPTKLGGQHFAQIWCAVSTPPNQLGTDDLPELADTYYLRTDR